MVIFVFVFVLMWDLALDLVFVFVSVLVCAYLVYWSIDIISKLAYVYINMLVH